MVSVRESLSAVMWIFNSRCRIEHVLIGHHLEAQAVERVGRIREQFPQEYFAVFVQRMDQNIKQLFRLGFE